MDLIDQHVAVLDDGWYKYQAEIHMLVWWVPFWEIHNGPILFYHCMRRCTFHCLCENLRSYIQGQPPRWKNSICVWYHTNWFMALLYLLWQTRWRLGGQQCMAYYAQRAWQFATTLDHRTMSFAQYTKNTKKIKIGCWHMKLTLSRHELSWPSLTMHFSYSSS